MWRTRCLKWTGRKPYLLWYKPEAAVVKCGKKIRQIYQLGVNPPADIASGRAHIVRWTMVLHRPKRSVDLQRCAVEVCHAIAWRAPRNKNAEAFLNFPRICRKNVVKPRKLSAKASEKSLWSSGSRHAQLGKDFPRCRAVALYISMKEPSLSSKLERWLFHVNVHGS